MNERHQKTLDLLKRAEPYVRKFTSVRPTPSAEELIKWGNMLYDIHMHLRKSNERRNDR